MMTPYELEERKRQVSLTNERYELHTKIKNDYFLGQPARDFYIEQLKDERQQVSLVKVSYETYAKIKGDVSLTWEERCIYLSKLMRDLMIYTEADTTPDSDDESGIATDPSNKEPANTSDHKMRQTCGVRTRSQTRATEL